MAKIVLLLLLCSLAHCQLNNLTAIFPVRFPNSTQLIFVKDFQYIQAAYGPQPSLSTWNLNVPTSDGEFCKIQKEKAVSKYRLESLSKQAIVVKRGGCTFVQKTKNAEKLGYDLLIISIQVDTWPIQLAPTGDITSITIPTIAIRFDDAQAIVKLFPRCPAGIQVRIGDQQIYRDLRLPKITFNIADRRSLSYLSEFYYHPYFQAFEPVLDYKLILLFEESVCSPPFCKVKENCIFSAPDHLCFRNTPIHNGRKIMTQQIRQYVVLKELGREKWWKYVILFNENQCFLSNNVDKCFIRCLNELEVSSETIKKINKRTVGICGYKLSSFKEIFTDVEITQIFQQRRISNYYRSSVNKTLNFLCHNLTNPPQQACQRLLHKDLFFKIDQYKQTSYQFIEPAGRENTTTLQLVKLSLSQSLMQNLDEIIIILSRCPGGVQWQFTNCEPYEYNKYTQKLDLTGRFGHRSKKQMTDDAVELYSIEKYDGMHHIINLRKKEILQKNITLQLKFTTSYRAYLIILPKKVGFVTLRPGDVEINFLRDQSKSFQICLQDIENKNLSQILIKIQGHFNAIQSAMYSNQNYSQTYSVYVQSTDPFIKYYSLPSPILAAIVMNSRSAYKVIRCQNNLGITSCYLYLNIRFSASTKNQLFKISVSKRTNQSLDSIQPYQPFYSAGGKVFDRTVRGTYVQTLKMRTFSDHSFRSFIQTSLVLTYGPLVDNIDVKFKICKQNYNCEIESIRQWHKLQESNQTQQLYFQNTTANALNSFGWYKSYKYYNNLKYLTFANPVNSIRRFLKIDFINVYIVFSQKNIIKQDIIAPKLLMPQLLHWDIIKSYPSFVHSSSQSCEFDIEKVYINALNANIVLIHKKIDQYVRIYARVIRQDFSELFFQPYSTNKNNTHLNSIFQKYYFLDRIQMQQAVKIQIIVEDRLKRPPNKDSPYYSIGFPCNYLSGRVNDILILQQEDRHVFAYAKSYKTRDNPTYKIKSEKNVIILHFNSELSVFQNKVMLCTNDSVCYNHSQFKVWKNIETNELVTGLKVNKQMKQGFTIEVLDFRTEKIGDEVTDQILQGYQTLPIDIRIRTQVLQSIVEVKQNKTVQHFEKYEDDINDKEVKNSEIQNIMKEWLQINQQADKEANITKVQNRTSPSLDQPKDEGAERNPIISQENLPTPPIKPDVNINKNFSNKTAQEKKQTPITPQPNEKEQKKKSEVKQPAKLPPKTKQQNSTLPIQFTENKTERNPVIPQQSLPTPPIKPIAQPINKTQEKNITSKPKQNVEKEVKKEEEVKQPAKELPKASQTEQKGKKSKKQFKQPTKESSKDQQDDDEIVILPKPSKDKEIELKPKQVQQINTPSAETTQQKPTPTLNNLNNNQKEQQSTNLEQNQNKQVKKQATPQTNKEQLLQFGVIAVTILILIVLLILVILLFKLMKITSTHKLRTDQLQSQSEQIIEQNSSVLSESK